MIRLCHLITGLGVGGAEQALTRLCHGLAERGYEQRVIVMLPPGPMATELIAAGCEPRSLGLRPGRPDPRGLTRLAAELRRFRPDLLMTWMYHADLLGTLVRPVAPVPRLVWNLRCTVMPDRRPWGLSRDSWLGQRKGHSLGVQSADGLVDRLVEVVSIDERLVRKVVCLEVVPDAFDVVQLGRIFRQPFDREPMGACRKRGTRHLAGVDRPVVLDQHDRLDRLAGPGTISPVELLEVSDEVAATLGRAGMHDEFARGVIDRAKHRHLLGLSRSRDTQIGARPGPDTRQIGVRQRLAFVAIEQDDVAGFGLLFAQLQAQPDAFDLGWVLTAIQRVPGPPPAELFFRNAFDSCERLMRTPSCASISARSREIVQFRRSATGASSRGVTTRKAVSLFTGAGPGATLAFRASMPPSIKALRQRRTVSSRTPNASAVFGLVQPASVSSTARARSASPRSREPANTVRPARCSSVAKRGDFPVMPRTYESMPPANRTSKRWSTKQNLLSRPCAVGQSLRRRYPAPGTRRGIRPWPTR